ncbi:SH3 domain-containing protein [Mesorhizobium xinjiangense]|uniref:SH3 domain-containing protein n=1 Tax=Mesorhizobium xinjiangense TaxID=2678685 RepID=UPI0012EDAAF3|nr:SH3 domain-containing protein [Mesorhizobium xinjiangense]
MSRYVSLRLIVSAALVGLAVATLPTLSGFDGKAVAQTVTRGPSGLPLPRFVSLKASRANLRVGPGRSYSVDWMYMKSGLPMEIIQEYGNWRRVRDSEGTEGWINQSLLSGRRTGLVTPWNRDKDTVINLLQEPDEGARVVAVLQPGTLGTISACNGSWCEMRFDGHEGWIGQTQIWGAYPDERITD